MQSARLYGLFQQQRDRGGGFKACYVPMTDDVLSVRNNVDDKPIATGRGRTLPQSLWALRRLYTHRIFAYRNRQRSRNASQLPILRRRQREFEKNAIFTACIHRVYYQLN